MLGCDLRSLAVLRIAVGAILLLDLALRFGDLEAHYTDEGVLTRADLLRLGWNAYSFSLHMGSGWWFYEALLFVLAGLAALALLLGYRTRLATALSWLLLCSLHARNPLILNSGDVLLRMLLLWGFFLPWGALASMDARGRPKPAELVVSPGTVGYLAQILLLYGFAFALKSGSAWRVEGTAVHDILSLDVFASGLGTWLVQFPELLRTLTFATLYLQLASVFLLLCPFAFGPVRTITVLSLTLMHAGIGLCIHIGVFTPIAMASALGLLPGWFWDRCGWKMGDSGPGIRAQSWQYLALPLLLLVAAENLSSYAPAGFALPRALDICGHVLQVEQRWSMFSPYPLLDDGWYVAEGQLRNGRSVNLLSRAGDIPDWSKPRLVSATFPNDRWRKLCLNLYSRDYVAYRPGYARWLAWQWNGAHRGPWQAERVRLWYVLERTNPHGEPYPVQKILLQDYEFR